MCWAGEGRQAAAGRGEAKESARGQGKEGAHARTRCCLVRHDALGTALAACSIPAFLVTPDTKAITIIALGHMGHAALQRMQSKGKTSSNLDMAPGWETIHTGVGKGWGQVWNTDGRWAPAGGSWQGMANRQWQQL